MAAGGGGGMGGSSSPGSGATPIVATSFDTSIYSAATAVHTSANTYRRQPRVSDHRKTWFFERRADWYRRGIAGNGSIQRLCRAQIAH